MAVPETLPALLDALVARHDERAALIAARARLSFRDLGALAVAFGAALAGRGVRRGTRVGLLLPNWPEWVPLAFAVWRCGGVLVPLSTLAKPRELAEALPLADVEVLITARAFLRHDYAAMLEAIAPGASTLPPPLAVAALPALRHVVFVEPPATGVLRTLAATGPASVSTPAEPDDDATILFTSGSTAAPKGVLHTQRALCLAADGNATVLGIGPDDRTWGYLPFFFAGGLVAVALSTLSRGAAVVLQDVFEPGETLRLLERERVSVFFAWPHQAEALLAHPTFDRTRLHLAKGVGANTRWAARLYPPDHHAVGSYGMTETPPLCAAWPWDAPLPKRVGSHGPPVGRRQLRIVDPTTNAALPVGDEGEVCVRGPELFRTYLDREPAECFDGDGWYHTGDLGRLDAEGALHFVGRLKDTIKTAGANVAAAEVEAVLLEHPAVGAAHVVGVPDAQRGENVAAFVVVAAAVGEAELVAHCRDRLASYKVPRRVWAVAEDALPKKASGKVDKAALRIEATQRAAVS